MMAGSHSLTGVFEYIDHYEGIGWFAKGWVETSPGSSATDLVLAVDGSVVERFTADAVREDLEAAGLKNARAFEVRLPEIAVDGQQHEIAIGLAEGLRHLQQSPRRFSVPRFRGRVERVSGLILEGWALDVQAPDRPVVLDVEVDGGFQQHVVADEVRRDLALTLGTNGRHAFRLRLPVQFCDGIDHQVLLRVANTDQMLQGGTVTINLAPDVVPAAMARLEDELAALDATRSELAEKLSKMPVDELADKVAYARWLTIHEAGWPSRDTELLPWDRPTPLFSLITDPGYDCRELASSLTGFAGLVELKRSPSGLTGFAETIAAARGDYLLFPGPLAEPHSCALRILADHLRHRRPPVLYTDDDTLLDGVRAYPRFKPTWDPERFLGTDYVGRAVAVRRDVAHAVLRQGIAVAASDDLIAGALLIVREEKVERLPLVLFHAKERPQAASPVRRAERLAPWVALREPSLGLRPAGDVIRLSRPVPDPAPEVTLVIPTRDRVDLLRMCIGSVLERTDYRPLHLLIVDNGSVEKETLAYLRDIRSDPRVEVIRDEGPFNFSRLNNRAVAQVTSPLICLLNNDIEVRDGGWLREMVSHALRPNVGAVGAKLLFPDGLVQHGGVVVGFHGVADNSQRGFRSTEPGYGNALSVTQRAMAVTAACLVCRREVYAELGGLDDTAFPVSFNDVDFCLRLRKKGYQVLWTPYAVLVHHESATRRVPGDMAVLERERQEADRMIERWRTETIEDPFYSPNLGLGGMSSHRAFRWPPSER